MSKRLIAALAGAMAALLAVTLAPPASAHRGHDRGGLDAHQQAQLRSIAKDTWKFFEKDVDPNTHLPLDNLGPGTTRGTYTSSANIGVYLWSVVAAHDLHLISTHEADARVISTLQEVQKIKRSHGFLFQWYDTTTGETILNPGDKTCAQDTSTDRDNCNFLSAVDNGWYASGLVVAREALPDVRNLATSLLNQMDFSIFYDNRAQKPGCNTNPDFNGDPTGQMYGGYNVGFGPATYHNGAIYSDPRIAMYLGMGMHQMPGDVWWRTWRTLPPKQCSTDPDFSWQGQAPGGYWTTIHDPLSGKDFRVWEGHYTYPGTSLKYVPTWGGGMFEGLMADQVVPETTWGRHSFGLADERTAQVQIKYATQALGDTVWGMSPSSTADDSGGYTAFGAQGLAFPVGERLSQNVSPDPNPETTVTPHASFLALDVKPQRAYANIERLRQLYPDSYTADGGFYDAVNPTTGAVGHRRLVLDQSMIMAALDNALNGRQMQKWFAKDPVSFAARAVLSAERMPLN
jgi:hypothetical protein